MINSKTYAVFGLGRYGTAVAKELVNNGIEVLAVDIDPEKVDEALDWLVEQTVVFYNVFSKEVKGIK